MGLIVLAGGYSSRMGQDKCALVLKGKSLLWRTINRLKQLHEEVIVVLAKGQSNPWPEDLPNVKFTVDLYSGKGPLMGIYAGLKASNHDYSIVVGCDMPFLNVNLLRYMLEVAPGFEIVTPAINGLVEPLHAVYSRRCVGIMEGMLGEGRLQVKRILEGVRVRYVDKKEIDLFDPDHLSLFNLNTPADLEKAKQILNQGGEWDDFC